MRCVRQEAALNELPVRLSSHLVVYLFSFKKKSPSMQQLFDLQLPPLLPRRSYVCLRPCTCGREEASAGGGRGGEKVLGFQVPARRKYVLHLCCAKLEPRL